MWRFSWRLRAEAHFLRTCNQFAVFFWCFDEPKLFLIAQFLQQKLHKSGYFGVGNGDFPMTSELFTSICRYFANVCRRLLKTFHILLKRFCKRSSPMVVSMQVWLYMQVLLRIYLHSLEKIFTIKQPELITSQHFYVGVVLTNKEVQTHG